ncbi:hypothetical protein M422DRAFT_42301 [Sphaerobolus stellatus SS14]|nr:hypothetical protein M422DRAFT_42301 [Sphaerobolus stellatus SS14]
MDAISKGIGTLLEGSENFIKVLDEVAKLHPFIGVAVLAFKTVWTLEMKRRENEKKVLALVYIILNLSRRLRNVKDPEDIGPDGSTIKSRIETLCKATSEDIKPCGNTCDAYMKKKLIVNSPRFDKCRRELEFALVIHTARTVDEANETFTQVAIDSKEILTKVDNTKASLLKEIQDTEGKSGGTGRDRKAGAKADTDEIWKDLHTDPDTAAAKNLEVFDRKFEVQKNQIVDEVNRIVQRQGERIISAITAGPRYRIKDPMRCVRYLEENTFNDDASGFVTVAEVNAFTTSRPADWSLPVWIAYWAVGWHMTLSDYRSKLNEILSKM